MVTPTSPSPKTSWLLLSWALIVLPLAAALGAGDVIVHPLLASGSSLIRLWYGPQRGIVVGAVALIVLLARRSALHRARTRRAERAQLVSTGGPTAASGAPAFAGT